MPVNGFTAAGLVDLSSLQPVMSKKERLIIKTK
jgi:hypothetical protein